MTNWLEKAEQERRRLAAEAEAKQLEAQGRSKEIIEEITRKLELYKELEIPQKLQEIKRDIFKGIGSITPVEQFYSDHGRIGHTLSGRIYTTHEQIRTIYEERWGRHTETEHSGYSGPYGMDHEDTIIERKVWGPYKAAVGQTTSSYDTSKDYDLSCLMMYSIDSGNYSFSVAGETIFTSGSPSQVVRRLVGFVDKSLLSFAMNPEFQHRTR